jgi:hypothetical protein
VAGAASAGVLNPRRPVCESASTTAQYDQVNEKLGIRAGSEPEGLLQHLAGQTDDGLLVVDVWESPEQFEHFFATGAADAIAEVGGPPVEPRVYPVHNMIRRGAGTEANVFLVVDANGFPAELYDDMVAKMPAHAGEGSSHRSVSHYAADKGGGGMVIADVWDSPESFMQFAEEQFRLGGVDLDLSALDMRFVPLHNRFAT